MVKEMTGLAGVMGKHYALKDGVPAEVAQVRVRVPSRLCVFDVVFFLCVENADILFQFRLVTSQCLCVRNVPGVNPDCVLKMLSLTCPEHST
jgi:hypothetical protein